MTEETLFELALNTPAAERAAVLDRHCAGDPELRDRVAALLAAHDRLESVPPPEPAPPTVPDTSASVALTSGDPAGTAMDDATVPPAPDDATAPTTSAEPHWTADVRLAEGVGSTLAGKYKLVEAIGEGGMGAVFMALQVAPVKRAVAVKVIKAGMDSRAVLARFDAERQALAMMDHPNIARVLDAGATESGRPFFVMELVKGTPITTFCDERRLTPRQRLELFVPVCQAIQHAHQKGVIHRDIKPSNVLVALYDDRPVPKVIDFGVAKAAGPQLTEQTLMTGFGAVVGTPEYMSPEQAALNNLDIDTRSDVYALGVLLYELLTGTTPVDRRSLGRAAILEVLRVVREEEPPRPSTRLSSSEALPSIAASRGVEPARLAGMLRGELDWIALKALEKDRARRYETANGLARDIERYLADEVVEARPPSAGYRLRKFVRRNKGQVLAASLVLLALVAGIIGTSWGLVRAERARRAEREARLEALEQKATAEAAGARARKRLEQIEKGNEILTGIFADLDIREVRKRDKPLEAMLADRLVKAAGQLEGEAVGDPLAVAGLQDRLGQSLANLGFAEQALPVLEKALATREARLGPNHLDTLTAISHLAEGYVHAGKLDRALPLFEETLPRLEVRLGPDHPLRLTAMGNLAVGYHMAGKLDRALPLYEEVLRLRKAKLGPDHPATLADLNNLGRRYVDTGKLDRALPLLEEALRRSKATLGPDHPDTLLFMSNLAAGYLDAGKIELALPLLEEALRRSKTRLGPDHPNTFLHMNDLAAGYRSAGKTGSALELVEEALRLSRARLGPDHPQTLLLMSNLAGALRDAGKLDRALPLLEEALRLSKAKLGPDHPRSLAAMSGLAAGYWSAHRLDRSVPLFENIVKLREKTLGRNHPETLQTVGDLGVNYKDAGRLDEALPLLEEAYRASRTIPTLRPFGGLLLDGYRRAGRSAQAAALAEELVADGEFGLDHSYTLSIVSEEAVNLWRAGRLDRSVPLFENIVKLREKTLGRNHPETLVAVANLGVNYKDAGRLDEALPLLEEAHRASGTYRTLRWVGAQLVDGYVQAGRATEAAALAKEVLADARKTLPKDSPQLAGALAHVGLGLLQVKAFADAEPILRECLAIREKAEPDAWTTFNARSLLGGALLGQKKYAEAGPLLLSGYEGMKAREKSIPPQGAMCLPESIDRLIELYTATNKPEEVKKWRAERARYDKDAGANPAEKK